MNVLHAHQHGMWNFQQGNRPNQPSTQLAFFTSEMSLRGKRTQCGCFLWIFTEQHAVPVDIPLFLDPMMCFWTWYTGAQRLNLVPGFTPFDEEPCLSKHHDLTVPQRAGSHVYWISTPCYVHAVLYMKGHDPHRLGGKLQQLITNSNSITLQYHSIEQCT